VQENKLTTKYTLRAHIREFKIPPVHEGLILGRRATIGCNAIRKSLALLMTYPFAHLELEDDVISDILVRKAVL
jgi:hypothetical protein